MRKRMTPWEYLAIGLMITVVSATLAGLKLYALASGACCRWER